MTKPDTSREAIEALSADLRFIRQPTAADVILALLARAEELEGVLIDATCSLVASVSLLERGGKKAAPSDKMFTQMILDYKGSIERIRAALTPQEPT